MKHPRPKILLIDMDADTADTLTAEGYNVKSGSFGTPYNVELSDKMMPVVLNSKLPSSTAEMDIVIIDTQEPDPASNSLPERKLSAGTPDWWARCNRGTIDPRPKLMTYYSDDFDRIVKHGGVLIVFADCRLIQEVHLGFFRHANDFQKMDDIHSDNWSFSSYLNPYSLEINLDVGEEVYLQEDLLRTGIGSLLSQHLEDTRFYCSFVPRLIGKDWLPLLNSKFGNPVSGIIFVGEEGKGKIFIFPAFARRSAFLRSFLMDVMPDLNPHLFPHGEGGKWVERDEYELPGILTYNQTIEEIREEARGRINAIEVQIDEHRISQGFLHEIIQETGDPLVKAIMKALSTIGFTNIVDIDERRKKAGEPGVHREDLWIEDDSPLILVEVKGITGLPTEANSLQVLKYISPRMKQLKRTDIRGLSVINHQRNIPALDRNNSAPFHDDVITNSEEQDFGLLTTWDLYRLTRSFLKNGWKPEWVKPLFYRNGRITPVPLHYEFVGAIGHYYDNVSVISVVMEAGELKPGDRIAFELPVEFVEELAEEIQIDREPIEQATAGDKIGIKTLLTKEQARDGVKVYRVNSEFQNPA